MRRLSKSPKRRLWDRCTHCFVGGVVISATIVGDHKLKTGHISRETDWGCTQRTGSNHEYAQTVPNMCKMWENRRCYRSTPSLFTMPYQLVLFKLYQQEHWGEHKILCEAIRELETLNQSSAKGEGELKISAPAHLTPRQHSKLTKLIGRRYILSCLLQGKKVHAPWDTAARPCIISKSWKDAYLHDVPVRDISELLGERELDLQVANGTAFLYDRWIEVQFQLLGEYGQSEPITLPILVSRQDNQEYR